MIRETDPELEEEVEERLDALRSDSDLADSYDVTGDGLVDEREWELVRRMLRLELVTRRRDDGPEESSREGTVVGERFRIIGMLGRGGQGTTYLAEDEERGGHVVVKELSLHTADHWKAIELFEREAEVLESIEHPRIPSYIDAFADETADEVRFLLVQEHVFGKDLESFIVRRRWNADEAWARLEELARVLSHLHRLTPPVVHRDVKPSNIVVAEETGALHLVDFGAAQNVVAETVGGSTVVGTSGYVPMEQYMGKASPASDVYALGATMVHCLTGVAPVDLPMKRGRIVFESRIGDDRFRRLLPLMLEPFAEERLPDASAVLREMHRIIDHEEEEAVDDGVAEYTRDLLGLEERSTNPVRALEVRGGSAIARPWLSVSVDHAARELVREIADEAQIVARPLSVEVHLSPMTRRIRTQRFRIVGVVAALLGGLIMLAATFTGGSALVAGPVVAFLIIVGFWFYQQSQWCVFDFDEEYLRMNGRELPLVRVHQITTTPGSLAVHSDGELVLAAPLPELEAEARVYIEQVLADHVATLQRGEQIDVEDVW